MGSADERSQIYAGALPLESLEVFSQRAPVNFQIEPPKKVLLFFDEAITHGRDRLAFASDFCGNALHYLTHRPRINQDIAFGLTQHVDKTRRDYQAARIDYALTCGSFQVANASNTIAFDGDV